MSMTAEERKDWAYEALNRWLRDNEAGELLVTLEQYLSDQQDIHDLAANLEETQRQLDRLSKEFDALYERLDELEGAAS